MLDMVVLTLLLLLLLLVPVSMCVWSRGVMRCYLVIANNRRFQRLAFRLLHRMSKPLRIPHTNTAHPRPPLEHVPRNRCRWASVAHSSLLTWNGPLPKVGRSGPPLPSSSLPPYPSLPCSLMPNLNPSPPTTQVRFAARAFARQASFGRPYKNGKAKTILSSLPLTSPPAVRPLLALLPPSFLSTPLLIPSLPHRLHPHRSGRRPNSLCPLRGGRPSQCSSILLLLLLLLLLLPSPPHLGPGPLPGRASSRHQHRKQNYNFL